MTNRRVKSYLNSGKARGVVVSNGISTQKVHADIVVLSAGGIGTAQILKASGLPAQDKLWVDVVLTVGGVAKGSRMLNESPMAWFIKRSNYILSPYFDILSYWFHKPWRDVSVQDRVGMMIKLADAEQGTVSADGTVTKTLTQADYKSLDKARAEAMQVMEASGVMGPYVDGMVHGGHLGGTA